MESAVSFTHKRFIAARNTLNDFYKSPEYLRLSSMQRLDYSIIPVINETRRLERELLKASLDLITQLKRDGVLEPG